MTKVYASDFIDKAPLYIGKPYSEMDCQAYVEKVLEACGVYRNWTGSNAMFRDVRRVLPVEMIVTEFGSVPAGALLFIWANDGGEPSKYKDDGQGNASHVGICMGKPGDQGAIHSSSSRGCVAWSKFNNKSITGGWNYAGFLKEVDYGQEIEAVLAEEGKDEDVMDNAIVVAENGKPVNMRREANKNSSAICQIPVGTEIFVVNGAGSEWYAIEYKGKKGFMMRQFVQLKEQPEETDESIITQPPTDEQTIKARLALLEMRVERMEKEWEDKMGWG